MIRKRFTSTLPICRFNYEIICTVQPPTIVFLNSDWSHPWPYSFYYLDRKYLRNTFTYTASLYCLLQVNNRQFSELHSQYFKIPTLLLSESFRTPFDIWLWWYYSVYKTCHVVIYQWYVRAEPSESFHSRGICLSTGFNSCFHLFRIVKHGLDDFGEYRHLPL